MASSIGNVTADKTIKCGDMKWSDKGHDDNNPSKSKFLKMAYKSSLCQLAKCVDHAKCANHVAVDWKHFKNSPAYLNATSEQKKELKEAHQDGNGANGLVGYEILEYGIKGED
jgi:hypothetical protein